MPREDQLYDNLEKTVMKKLLVLSGALLMAGGAGAIETLDCDWEGTETVLGMFPDAGLTATLVGDPIHGGTQSLELERLAASTPQAYIGFVWGLQDGDVVTAGYWRYDVSPDAAPSTRIWGHWNDDLPADLTGYNGSAGGNSDYGTGEGWDYTEYTWTVVDGHTGLGIEARIYSNPGDIVWIDDLHIEAPDGACVMVPGQNPCVGVQEISWSKMKANNSH
ncbi:MAG: hypothetical protein CME06_00840 [Gemmatimonadetes bacterium]|nr:hypothetical protein [Gemmatimonadota bacterium]